MPQKSNRFLKWLFNRSLFFLLLALITVSLGLDRVLDAAIINQLDRATPYLRQVQMVDSKDFMDNLETINGIEPVEQTLDSDTRIIAVSGPQLFKNLPISLKMLSQEIRKAPSRTGKINGLYFQRVEAIDQESPAYYLVYEPSYFKSTQAIFNRVKIASLLAIILVFLLGRLALYGTVTKPIREMSQQLRHIVDSDYRYYKVTANFTSLADLNDSAEDLVTQLRHQYRNLEDSERRLSILLNHLNLGVLLIDDRDRIELNNPESLKLLDLSAPIVGLPFETIIRSVRLVELIRAVQKDEQAKQEEIEFYYPDYRVIDVNIIPYQRERSGHIAHSSLVLLYDVTRNRKLETIRTEFVANASHELRTPVTAIKGFAETLLDGALSDPDMTKQFVEIIAKESNRLEVIIHDILELSRVEKNSEPWETQLLDLVATGKAVLQLFKQASQQKNIRMNFSSNIDQLMIDSNKHRLEQIMINLIDNAINYSDFGGEILLAVEKVKQGALIQVSDKGIGIPEADQSRIFERFYRVDKDRSRNSGGTGLGLSIVNNLVRIMEGNIQVTSVEGQGTTFKIFIPINY